MSDDPTSKPEATPESAPDAGRAADASRSVEDLKAKYPNLKRVDLLTMLRAPGNVPCGDGGSLETLRKDGYM